jgi:superfamily II DNA helicase RecQ
MYGMQFENLSLIVIVVSPLNALIANQILRLNSGRITATALDVSPTNKEVLDDSEP